MPSALAEQVGDGAGALDDWVASSSPAGQAPWATEENLPTTLDEQQRPNRSGSSLVDNDHGGRLGPIARHLRTELVTDALVMAVNRRRPPIGQTVIHSDRGCQYTSHEFRELALANGIIPSVGHTGISLLTG